MNSNINFPHLHLFFENVGRTIKIGSFPIAYYGLIIASAILVGIYMALHEAKRTGQKEEDYLDLAIIAVLFSIAGARIYYVIFSWDHYKNDLVSILNLREGGLAIFGGIIAAVITVFLVAKHKKIHPGLMLDTACMGLVTGQIIGRWGNFFNREAFGGYTDSLLAMQIPINAVRESDINQSILAHTTVVKGIEYIQVHPTFLYESMWNIGVLIVLFVFRKKKSFQGELFILYLTLYSLGRVWIEGLRTDQLLILDTNIAVSQLLSALLVVSGTGFILYMRFVKNRKKQ